MVEMERYEIRGIYPNDKYFQCFAEVEDQRDVIAIAQGLRKVTTIRIIAVYLCDDGHCVYYDKLRTNW